MMERYFKHTLWRMEKQVLLLHKPKLPTQLSTMFSNLAEHKPMPTKRHTLHHLYQRHIVVIVIVVVIVVVAAAAAAAAAAVVVVVVVVRIRVPSYIFINTYY